MSRSDKTPVTSAVWVLLIVTQAAAGCQLLSLATVIPRDALTRTNMVMCQERIEKYHASHSRLPSSLAETPTISGRSDRPEDLSDGWGRPIQYQRKDENNVTLTSLGADALKGGKGSDADIEVSFSCSQQRTAAQSL